MNQNNDKSSRLRKKAEKILAQRGIDNPDLYKKDLESLVQELSIHQIELEQQNEELKRTQNELEISRDQYSDLFNNAPIGYFIIQNDYKILHVNQTGAQLINRQPKDLEGTPITHYIQPDYQDTFYFHLKNVLGPGQPNSCELQLRKNNSETIYVNVESLPVNEPETNHAHHTIRAAIWDITDKKEKEKVIQQSETKYRTIFDHSAEGFLILKDTIQDCNRQAAWLFGYKKTELIGKHPVRDLSPEKQPDGSLSAELGKKYLEEALKGINQHFYWKHVTRKGRPIDTDITLSAFEAEDGKYLIAIVHDISEQVEHQRQVKEKNEEIATQNEEYLTLNEELNEINSRLKKTIEDLEASEDKFKNYIESSPTSVILTDKAGTIQYTNKAAQKLLGFQEAYLRNKSIKDVQGDIPEKAHPSPFDDLVRHKKIYDQEAILLDKSGNPKNVIVNAIRLSENRYLSFLTDITERKIAENKLKEANDIINKSPAVAFVWKNEPNWPVEFVSENVEKLLGYPSDDFINKKIYFIDVIYPEDKERIVNELLQYSNDRATEEFTQEYRIIDKSGDIKWVDDRTWIERDDHGHIKHFKGMVWDITERKNAETQLLYSEELLNETGDMARVGGWEINLNEQTVYWTRTTKMIHEVPLDYEPTLEEALQFFPGQSNKLISQAVKDAMERGKNFDLELEFITAHHNKRFIRAKGQSIFHDGKCIRVNGTAQDITKRKLTEKALKSSEQKFRTLFDSASDAIYILNLEGKIMEANNLACNRLKYAREELINLSPKDFIVPEKQHEFDIRLQEIITKGYGSFENEHIAKDGAVIPVEVNSKIIEYSGRKAVLTISRDITERKKNEKELLIKNQISNAFIHNEDESFYNDILNIFRNFFESRYGYFGYINNNGDLVSNSLTRDVWDQCQVENKTIIFPKEKWGGLWGDSLKKKQTLYRNEQLNPPKGHIRLTSAIAAPIILNNRLIGQIALANKEKGYDEKDRDMINALCNYIAPLLHSKIREEEYKEHLLEAKEKAEESDRLKSAFLTNMSHEIRTPMNGILGFTQILLSKTHPDINQKKYLDIIYSRGKHLLQIINDIIDISKIEANQLNINRSYFYLNDLMEEIYQSYHAELEHNHISHIQFDFLTEFARENSYIYTDKGRLRQILTNLLSNAFKFTNEGQISFGYKRSNEQTLRFFVKDTGIGIPADKQKYIFDRFRQVEESLSSRKHEGTGLGLSISRNLVALLDGELWLESELNKGSIFYFTLPLKQGKGKEKAGPEQDWFKTEYNWNNKKILVVEDDPVSQKYIREILHDTGAELLLTDNGKEAYEIFSQTPDISMILLDLKLPDKDGREITQDIRQAQSDVPIIAQSAYAMEEDRIKCLEAGCDDFISKPVNPKSLLAMMDEHLNKPIKS